MFVICIVVYVFGSAVEEVGGHEKLQCDLGRDGELGDLRGTVGVSHLIIIDFFDW